MAEPASRIIPMLSVADIDAAMDTLNVIGAPKWRTRRQSGDACGGGGLNRRPAAGPLHIPLA